MNKLFDKEEIIKIYDHYLGDRDGFIGAIEEASVIPEKYFENRCLQSEYDINNYFMDCGADHLECGQGFYEDDVLLKVKTADGNIYEVRIEADIESQKMDVGDRVYWVDVIRNVTYIKLEK